MKELITACYAKPLALYLVLTLLAISTLAGPAEAMYVSPIPAQGVIDPASEIAGRAADLAKVQAAFESKIVRQKLLDYGLSPAAAMARVDKLSNKQLHALATHTDSLQAGGDGAGLFFGLIVVALLVVVLVFLLQDRIEIRGK